MAENVSQDFVFGTLASDELRLAHLRAARMGLAHTHQLEPLDPAPGQPVTIAVSAGPRISAERVTCYYTTNGDEPHGERGHALVGRAVHLIRTGVAWDTLLWGYVEHWSAVIPPQPAGTIVRYRIEAWSEHGGQSAWASEVAGVVAGDRPANLEALDAQMFAFSGQQPLWPIRRTGSYAYYVDDEHVPEWLRDAVIYHVFVDRFAPASYAPFAEASTLSGFFGGTLRGIIERLDYISRLGATCIWLSPIFPSPSHHGYDATDYRQIEPRLGTEADVRELIAEAHSRGIRIVFDFVVNHISSAHPVFQAALADKDGSSAGWFTFTRWPDQYLSFFGVQDLPQIDSDTAPAKAYMIEHARYWLEQGVDGFRLDYANGPSHAFWSEFRAATRAVKPDSVTFGEVVETAALLRSYVGRMDGCLDFLLLQALRQFFAFGSITASMFDTFLRRHLAFFPGNFVLPSFLDNHDMNRFLWVVGGDVLRLKLAAICQFTLPAPPIVYYGTEVGLSQARDVRSADGSGHPEESRQPMLWGEAQDQELLEFYRRLIQLRRRAPGIWRGLRQPLAIDDANGLYVYRCSDGATQAIVALNNGASVQHVELPANSGGNISLASDTRVALEAHTLRLSPYSGAVLWS